VHAGTPAAGEAMKRDLDLLDLGMIAVVIFWSVYLAVNL
jgi:hypothetical protein